MFFLQFFILQILEKIPIRGNWNLENPILNGSWVMWSYAQFFSTNTRKTKKRMRNVTLQSWYPGWHTCTTSAYEIYNRQCWVLLTLVFVSVLAHRYAIFICSLDVEIDENLSSYICPGLGLDLSLVLAWVLYFFLLKCCRSFGVCLGVCRSIELCLRGREGWLKSQYKVGYMYFSYKNSYDLSIW